MRILGMMTGTSCDGLDAVCADFTEGGAAPRWEILWSCSVPYPKTLREKVLKLQLPERRVSIRDFLRLDRDLGEWYGKSAHRIISTHDAKPEIVANHGQTVAHHPDLGSTLQLGDPTRIAQATGLSVISHFREGDMTAGGQGAPLLPLFHRMLATRLSESALGVAIHNLGGISNLTYIHPTDPGATLAFDTGPSNIWIDDAVSIATHGKKEFDANGAIARKGTPDQAAVKKILALPYFKKAPPKSTGRDDFPFSMLRSKTRCRGENLVATATLITVESIARAYEDHVLKKGFPLRAIYFAGGGAKNSYLLELLAKRLVGVQVKTLAESGIPKLNEQVLEGLGFALFGYLSLMGKPLGGSWTGVKDFGAPGWITPGRNWAEILSRSSALIR